MNNETTNLRAVIKELLWALAFAGGVAAVLRFAFGLGATTGLNDASPWGLWIAFKLGFVALAGGGFTLAAMVYIFHLEAFRPIVRRAILLALLGYGSFIVSLLFDLGLPWHIYMPIINWQHHSVMFEIAWCVMLYFSVLVMEFGPVILEHAWFQRAIFHKIAHLLHMAVIPLVIAGIVLSTLHQSSLGSLFLIMPHRVHPLWYSPLIPVLFFISAIAAGMLALILESFMAERLFGKGQQTGQLTSQQSDLLPRLAKIGGFALSLYLLVRLSDLFWRGVLPGALDGSWQSLLFGAEILIGGLLPIGLLMFARVRNSREGLITCSLLGIGGVLSQRMSLSMISMWRPEHTPYWPSLLEIIIALAIPAAAGLIYFLFIENLAVSEARRAPEGRTSLPAQPGQRGFLPKPGYEQGWRPVLIRRSALAVVVVALMIASLPPAIASSQPIPAVPVRPALGWNILTIDGNRANAAVPFAHSEHQERLSAELGDVQAACQTCHHLNLPGDEATPCSSCHRDYQLTTAIFQHTFHQAALGGNASCQECHAGEHLASTAADCKTCHEDMAASQPGDTFSSAAPAYQQSLHDLCLECHTREAEMQNRPELGQCGACHSQKNQNSELVFSTIQP
jgi:Ni/Fe-hydrogenase subunit HybB-like protein